MQSPWVSRAELDAVEKELADAKRLCALHQGRADELKEALMRSENERTDLQFKLIRVGFGQNPFEAATGQPLGANLPPDEVDRMVSPPPVVIPQGMPPDEVQATFTREAIATYGPRRPREIKRHVESRLSEYYGNRNQPPVLSAAEQAKASQIVADMDAALAEGRANAAALGVTL